MTNKDRISELEARVLQLEAQIAAIHGVPPGWVQSVPAHGHAAIGGGGSGWTPAMGLASTAVYPDGVQIGGGGGRGPGTGATGGNGK